jgi:hypothetical protein
MAASSHPPVRIHPNNPRYFEFRGKPLVLLCATEHYGSVMNRPFRFERYLADHAEKGHTLSRLFLLFRELQAPVNPYSPCKPESPDYIAPWPRTGPGKALDGEPQYDLSRWNDEFFERLHRFFSLASQYGIVIEVTLFSNTYQIEVWNLNPLNPNNNIQRLGPASWNRYLTTSDAPLWEKQQEYIRKVVTELNVYDNFYFEVCNEPGTFNAEETPPQQIDAWQDGVARLIRATEATLPNQHLVVGGQAFTIPPFYQPTDESFANPSFDAVTIHPLPDTNFGGRTYDMGAFMSKQLHLQEYKEFTLAVAQLPKPVVHDEDNIASCYRDFDGWTIHRKRAWVAAMCGAHYDVIDFSIVVHAEAGTEESRRHIRSWIGHLSRFIHSMDVPRTRPLGDWLLEKPPGTLECTLAVEGEDYAVYLADPRELTEAGAGSPLSGTIHFAVPAGTYRISIYSPVTGGYSPALRMEISGEAALELEPFCHDIVVRIQRAD